MKRVFADTSYWVALLIARDPYHRQATEASRRLGSTEIVTSELVLVESLNYVSSFGPNVRNRFGRLVTDLTSLTFRSRLVMQDRPLLLASIERYLAREDKNWSLTDCNSFIIMEQLGVQYALSSDSDYRQAGFEILLA